MAVSSAAQPGHIIYTRGPISSLLPTIVQELCSKKYMTVMEAVGAANKGVKMATKGFQVPCAYYVNYLNISLVSGCTF